MADLLLIENDARIVELLAWFLEKNGHAVRCAHSFDAARIELIARRPDLVLSDLDLGAESGREELPRLAAEGLLPTTLVVSGYVDRELDRELALVPAIVGWVRKPFDLTLLETRIAEALAISATRASEENAGWVDVTVEGDVA